MTAPAKITQTVNRSTVRPAASYRGARRNGFHNDRALSDYAIGTWAENNTSAPFSIGSAREPTKVLDGRAYRSIRTARYMSPSAKERARHADKPDGEMTDAYLTVRSNHAKRLEAAKVVELKPARKPRAKKA